MTFYLSHRLAVAGFTGGRLFAPGALKALHKASGFPRLINILAHKSLMMSYGQGKQQVLASPVHATAVDTGAARMSTMSRNIVAGLLSGFAACGAAWTYLR